MKYQARKDIETFLKTGRYKYDIDSVVIRVEAPRATFRDFFQYFKRSGAREALLLFGCAYSWLAVDVRSLLFGFG